MEKEANKIIFLDVDGVLTSKRCNGYYDFDLWAVNFLRDACERSGAKIVMSSYWRLTLKADEWFRAIFEDYLHTDWRTTGDSLKNRSAEINSWLAKHSEVESFVVVDDDLYGLEEHKDYLVLTSIDNGLLWDEMIQIHQFLGIQGGPPNLQPIFQHPVCFYTQRESKRLEYQQWVKEVQERNTRKTQK
jgi:hypothetical protein